MTWFGNTQSKINQKSYLGIPKPGFDNRVKGSSDSSHFMFEINVGKSRIRHITTLNLNFQSFLVDLEIHHSNSEPFYDVTDSVRHFFKYKMAWVWTTLKVQNFRKL